MYRAIHELTPTSLLTEDYKATMEAFRSCLRLVLLVILLNQLHYAESFAVCRNRVDCRKSTLFKSDVCPSTKYWTMLRSKDDSSDSIDGNIRKLSNFDEGNVEMQQQKENSVGTGRSYSNFGNLSHFLNGFVVGDFVQEEVLRK